MMDHHPKYSTFLEQYTVHSKKLGEGGFGVVRLAMHNLTKQLVAIKVIDKEKISKDLFRVKNEIFALKKLRHKNIAKLLQVMESTNKIYLIMEYCGGGELFDFIVSRNRVTEKESRKIIRSLVEVLAFIHQKGFAHRDIKPENIMLDEEKNIKIIDFGLCASTFFNGRLDCLSTCCGSPAYVAPELLLNKEYSGPAADVWSTGVLLYALLCGRLPFTNDNLSLLYNQIKEGKYQELPKYISNSASHLISRMLCTNPKKRITLQEIIEHKWLNESNQWSKTKILCEEVMKQDECEIDERILLKCAALFPNLDLNDLKNKIQREDGYHSATYWLVKQKPESFPDFDLVTLKRSNRRRSRSFSDMPVPETKKPLQDGQHGQHAINRDVAQQSAKPNKITPVKITPAPKVEPKTAVKQVRIPKPLPLTDVKRYLNVRTTEKTTAPVKRANRRLFAIDEKNTETTNNNENEPPCQPPTNSSLPKTTKKSILKYLVDSATPKKLHRPSQPRRFAVNDSLKNIIITELTNGEECLTKMVNILMNKQINCTVKNYTVRCSISTSNVILVSFELEILICRNTGVVGIQHRRISGPTFDYVKICDDLKCKLFDKVALIPPAHQHQPINSIQVA